MEIERQSDTCHDEDNTSKPSTSKLDELTNGEAKLGGPSENETSNISEAALEKLVSGMVNGLTPDFKQAQSTLQDLTKNQHIIIETVTAENQKFNDCEAFKEVVKVMEKAKIYQNKLLQVKKDMVMLHEKSAKLKKRSLKLQQQRQKEALEREATRERELEKERMLVAQPAPIKHTGKLM